MKQLCTMKNLSLKTDRIGKLVVFAKVPVSTKIHHVYSGI